jgi:GNAT superfamily N-acetyltransferase
MASEWMPVLDIPLTWEQFHQLPRNAAYKYEYFDGCAHLSPRPKYYHALLDMTPLAEHPLEGVDPNVVVRPVVDDDWEELAHLFAAAFHRQQPFSSLADGPRKEAADKSLEQTRTGGDGPWLPQASFVGLDHGHTVGAVLITLLPDTDPTDWHSFHWRQPPPPDLVERREGRPHLTWIFVAPIFAGHGAGTALLQASVRELLALGYTQLASTFLAGNDSSMLWHWRNGFRLVAYPGSLRRFRELYEKGKS